MGIWIALEGVDKSGKTTLSEIVSRELQEEGYSVLTDQWLGGLSVVTQKIRQILVHDADVIKNPEHSLEWAAALIMVKTWHYTKLLKEYDYVISDRGPLSTLVYQGYAQAIGVERAKEITQLVTTKPNLTILVDIDFDTFKHRGRAHHDNWENDEMVQKLIAGYRECLKEITPHGQVDGTKSIETVVTEVLKQIKQLSA